MGTLVYDPYVLNSILGPLLWRIMTCAQGPHMTKSGPECPNCLSCLSARASRCLAVTKFANCPKIINTKCKYVADQLFLRHIIRLTICA